MRTWKVVLFAVLFTSFLAAVSLRAEQTPPGIGDFPPVTSGKDFKGNEFDLESLKGRVVIVTFWATWCAPCIKELDRLNQIAERVGTERLQVIAINFKEDRRLAARLVRQVPDTKIRFVYDPVGRLSKPYRVKTLPRMYILDHEGRIAKVHEGYSEEGLPVIIKEIIAALQKSEEAAIARRAAEAPQAVPE